jgi:hypothetical protein
VGVSQQLQGPRSPLFAGADQAPAGHAKAEVQCDRARAGSSRQSMYREDAREAPPCRELVWRQPRCLHRRLSRQASRPAKHEKRHRHQPNEEHGSGGTVVLIIGTHATAFEAVGASGVGVEHGLRSSWIPSCSASGRCWSPIPDCAARGGIQRHGSARALDQIPKTAAKLQHRGRRRKHRQYALNWAGWCAWRESNPLPCGPEPHSLSVSVLLLGGVRCGPAEPVDGPSWRPVGSSGNHSKPDVA